jgi:Kef-type K+ transport system membrane component KefB
VSVTSFLIALIAIFLAAKLFGVLAELAGQPAVLGELIGGIVVGVSGFHLVNPHDVTIHLLTELGVILLLFLTGLETDLSKLMEVGAPASAVAVIGVALPFAGGFAFAHALGFSTPVSALLGASLTATSVGITARVLSDLGHLHDPESRVILGAAVLDDIIGLMLLAFVGSLAEHNRMTVMAIVKMVVVAFGFVILSIVIGSYLVPFLIRAIDRIHVARGLFFSSLVFALALALIARSVGSAEIIGAFCAGLILARTGRGEEIFEEVHDVAQFFIPIFFVAVGAAIDVREINPFDAAKRPIFLLGLGLTAIGIVAKIAAGYVVRRKGLRRLVIGVGMVPRGEVGLVFAQIGLSSGLVGQGAYSAIAMMVMITTLATPPLLRALLEQRTPEDVHGLADLVVDAPMDKENKPAR